MNKIQEIINEYKDHIDRLRIDELLYGVRNSVGMKIYKAAELSGMHFGRLKRIEAGLFRRMPTDQEIEGICATWGFEKKVIKKKMEDYINDFNNKNFGSYIE